ncbi:SH3-containing GRB2-like protein 3-interacting protein 1 isoform X2 [Engraulis encrasicolus]|uniref:SH3-containing GRB2-like protein 3-interacting protein 1 isoform X2 n=1 Tax=Engraulis encrasicolus TaxID=184585 RepID=UPI002FD77EEC
MMEGLKKRTRKAFGIRKKEKDNDSTGSPDREGSQQKKTNGAPNGFYGEIDWDRYNTPEVDDEGYSVRPEDDEDARSPKEKKHFFSSSESEGEEDNRPKFKIKIKPLAPDKTDYAAPSVDVLKASIGNIALSPSLRRSPGQLKRNTSGEDIARPRRHVPVVTVPAPPTAAAAAPAPAVASPAPTPPPDSAPTPPPEPPSIKKPTEPEDATALFGPPLDTAFDDIKSEVVIDHSEVWGAPISELSPDSSLARAFPTGNVSKEDEEGPRKPSIADLDNIFGPEDGSKPGEDEADQWVCFTDESPDRPPPPEETPPPLPKSPPPPDEPAPPLPTSAPPVPDTSSLPPLPTSPPPAEDPKPLSPPPVPSPPKETVPPLPLAQTPPKDTASALPPPPEEPAPPPPPAPPEDVASPLSSPPPLLPPPASAETAPLKSPPGPLPMEPFPEPGAGAEALASPPAFSTEAAAARTIPPPLVLSEEDLKGLDGNQQKDDTAESIASPKDVSQGSRATPPPPPPPTYRAVVSSPGPCPPAGGSSSGSSSPARPATPSGTTATTSSPTPPPPPPRPQSRPKLPPGKPSVTDNRPFSPPIHSSSPPPMAPLARAESTSSISSTNSLSAATTPTVGKDLTVSVSENDQPSLVWFDRGKFYLTFEGCSRGPSPLTMGAQDTLPVAAAFTETVNAYFKGADPSKCVVKVTGEMVLSFPAGITRHFSNNPSPAVLTFSITNYSRLEHVLPNPQLLCCDTTQSNPNSKEFWVNMPNLMTHLKKVAEQKPQATYYNVDMLKYQVSAHGVQSIPLSLATNWRCEPGSTDIRIDYKYNGDAMTTPVALNNVQFLVPVDGGVSKLQAVLPPAAWNAEQQRILWKIPDISLKSENGGVGSLLARFQLSGGPTKPAPLAVQFTSEGSNLSGCDIKLVGPGYRFSLIKKRFAAGKYLAD